MARQTSWIASANAAETQFPVENLPLGVFSLDDGRRRQGMAIGNHVLDLSAVAANAIFEAQSAKRLLPANLFEGRDWNAFIGTGPQAWDELRAVAMALVTEPSFESKLSEYVYPQSSVRMHLPIRIAEYTDFYASKTHAQNVGTMFRGAENALPPNWLYMPIGYNGRASSVIVSGTPVRRPWGQIRLQESDGPTWMPSQRFDIELELGAIVGVPSCRPLTVAEADAHIFGYVLLNDWSARDIQAWEYQPLGPFQGKATATSISPWIVMKPALEPFRRPAPAREVPLLPHLADDGPMFYDIELSVQLQPRGSASTTVCQTNARELYYSAAQQLVHHTSSGCAMRVGDLLGSGTISGPTPDACGSLLEMSWNGTRPVALAGGETRSFLEDGDRVTLAGQARHADYIIGFGTCVGEVLPAQDNPFEGE